jgi:hypothetical protein
MTEEWRIESGVKGSGRVLILRYYPGICLDELRKTTKNLRVAGLGPRFEPGISLIRSRSVNHSTTTFGASPSFPRILLHFLFHSNFVPKFICISLSLLYLYLFIVPSYSYDELQC